MYQLLKGNIDFYGLKRPADIEYHRVFDTVHETGTHHFLHGVAVEEWGGRLIVSFAYNDARENSITERLMLCWSDDQGKTWSKPESLEKAAIYANSHSVFWVGEDSLWCLGPRFKGLGNPPLTSKGHRLIHFVDLQMEAWRYSDGRWKPMGIVCDDFWPLSAPMRMSDGNWLISGCDSCWYGAIAISDGSNVLHWTVVKPDTDAEVFTEASAWVNGSDVLMVMRNESVPTGGRYHAAVAHSSNNGRTFSPCEISNLPMATTKPFCGHLSDGRPFIIFNEALEGSPRDRSSMLLGIGKPGEFSVCKLFRIDEGYSTSEGRRLALSYPYARQVGDKLYITYSYESSPGSGCNNNDAMLAVLNVSELA